MHRYDPAAAAFMLSLNDASLKAAMPPLSKGSKPSAPWRDSPQPPTKLRPQGGRTPPQWAAASPVPWPCFSQRPSPPSYTVPGVSRKGQSQPKRLHMAQPKRLHTARHRCVEQQCAVWAPGKPSTSDQQQCDSNWSNNREQKLTDSRDCLCIGPSSPASAFESRLWRWWKPDTESNRGNMKLRLWRS